MNLKTFIWPFACKLLLGSAFAQSSLLAPGALTNGYQITDRGKDFAVIARIRSSTNAGRPNRLYHQRVHLAREQSPLPR